MPDKYAVPPPSRSGAGRRGTPGEKPKNMKGALRRLWQITSGSRSGLGGVLLLSLLASLASMFSPLLVGNAITCISEAGPLVYALLPLAALYLCDWLARFLQQFFMASISQRMIRTIRTSLFSALKNLPLAYFDKRQHGELMSRLTNDVDNISTTVSDALAQLMVYAVTIIGVFSMMLFMSLPLTGVAMISVGLILLLTRTVTRQTRRLYAAQQAVLGRMNGQVEESVSGLSVVKAFCCERRMIEQFEKSNAEYCRISTKALIWSGYLMPLTNVINNFSYAAVAVLSGLLAAHGSLEIGLITSFLLYTKQFSRPFVDIANIYNSFLTALAGAERVFAVLDEPAEPADRPDALTLDQPRGEVVFDKVSFGYDPGKTVLHEISFRIPAGTRAAIVGQTGSGKTTIINLLTRFYDVDDGAILLDGADLRDYRLADLRRAFGVVLQDPSLFGVTIRENIAYGRSNVSMEEIVAAAKVAGADAFIRRLPQGYDTPLTQGGAALSQGERQLLTIARAVLADAPILILDEATSSVDTVTEQKIRRAMLNATAGRTSFIIAHRLSTIRDSDIIFLLDQGRIAEQGSHEQLMALNGQYAAMYRTQSGQNG